MRARIFQVHVKDPRSDRTPCYLEEGDIDIEGCLKALVDIDYQDPLVFETLHLGEPRKTAERNLRTLRDLIAKVEN